MCIFCNELNVSERADVFLSDAKQQILIKKDSSFKCSATKKHLSGFCKAKMLACGSINFNSRWCVQGKMIRNIKLNFIN